MSVLYMRKRFQMLNQCLFFAKIDTKKLFIFLGIYIFLARFKRNASDFSITSEPPKDRYPKQIFPYLGFEFFERFCNYGIGGNLLDYNSLV